MKRLLMLPTLSLAALFSLSSCSVFDGNAGTTGQGVREGYFFSGSNRSGAPMHWQKREKLRLGSSATPTDPALSELTAEDIANIKAMRKKQG